MSILGDAASTPSGSGGGFADLVSSLSSLSPLFSLGLGGVLAVMLIKRIWIMPVGEFEDYKAAACAAIAAAERVRDDTKTAADERILGLQGDLDTAREQVSELTDTIIKQVVPAITRVQGPLTELVELKRKEQRKPRGSGD